MVERRKPKRNGAAVLEEPAPPGGGTEPRAAVLPVELVDPRSLRPHPRNYQEHPDDQLAHLIASIEAHGFYKNVVVSRDGVILAGHGAVKAAIEKGMDRVPVTRLELNSDDDAALQVVVGDNEIGRLALRDDRLMTDILKQLRDQDVDLLQGTGFDDAMLAGLAMVTRPVSEIEDKNEAMHWLGMPEYDEGTYAARLIINFESIELRDAFLEDHGMRYAKGATSRVASAWWPPREREDTASVEFEG